MKLLEVCTSQSWGGMEMRTLKTAQAFKDLGHSVSLLCYPKSSLNNEAQKTAFLSKIYFLRQDKVLLDQDLAELFGVETKVLKRAVRRKSDRFPKDFMFELSKEELENLRSQFGTSSWGERRYSPMAFTEQDTAMLSSVLNSERAIKVNIAIIRAFVKMREYLQTNDKLARKLKELEKETKEKFSKQQEQIALIFDAIKELMKEDEKPKRKIGY